MLPQIIMEYADAGSVQDILDEREDQEKVLNEEQIAAIAQQVLKALQYLHSMKKIHRDIKGSLPSLLHFHLPGPLLAAAVLPKDTNSRSPFII